MLLNYKMCFLNEIDLIAWYRIIIELFVVTDMILDLVL